MTLKKILLTSNLATMAHVGGGISSLMERALTAPDVPLLVVDDHSEKVKVGFKDALTDKLQKDLSKLKYILPAQLVTKNTGNKSGLQVGSYKYRSKNQSKA